MGQKMFAPLLAEMEKRWEERFGNRRLFARLRRRSSPWSRQLDRGLPDCLPILGYGLRNDDRLTKFYLPIQLSATTGDSCAPREGSAGVCFGF